MENGMWQASQQLIWRRPGWWAVFPCCRYSALKIFKYLFFFSRQKLSGESDFLIYLSNAYNAKYRFPGFIICIFFILGAKPIYDYNVITLSWPCWDVLFSWVTVLHVLGSALPAVSIATPTLSCWAFPQYVYIFFLSFYFQTVWL